METKNTLIQNTFLYAIGPLLNRGLIILLIPFYSYLLLPAEMGYYDAVITIGNLLIAVVTIKISDGMYRWLMDSESKPDKQSSTITNSLVILITGIVLLGIAFLFITRHFVLTNPWLVYLYIISTILFIHLQQILRGLGFIKLYVYLAIINAFLLLLLNIVFLVILKYKISGILISLIAANLLSCMAILIVVHLGKYIQLRALNKAEIKKLALYSTPLVFNSINWWLMMGFDRIVIVKYLGYDANGIYAVAYKFAAVLVLLNSFFIPAWQDFLLINNKAAAKKNQFTNYFNRYLILQLSLFAFLAAATNFFILYFIDIKYVSAWKYTPILLAGTFFLAITSFLGSFFIVHKNTWALFKTTLTGSLINILISISLINQLGLYAPCIGMCAGFLVIFLLRYNQLKNSEGLAIYYKPFLLLLGCISVVTTCLYFPFPFANYFALVISTLILLAFNKSILLGFINFLKKAISMKVPD